RVSVLPLIEHLQRFAPCCLLAVVDFAQVQNLPLCYFPRLQTPTFHHRVIAVFLPVLDPRIAAQKHSQLQNARNCPPCIEGRSPLQALAKMFCSAQMTCRDDSPTFRPKSVSTAKVGLGEKGIATTRAQQVIHLLRTRRKGGQFPRIVENFYSYRCSVSCAN